jgi:hypothetical protein
MRILAPQFASSAARASPIEYDVNGVVQVGNQPSSALITGEFLADTVAQNVASFSFSAHASV